MRPEVALSAIQANVLLVVTGALPVNEDLKMNFMEIFSDLQGLN
jgi:hypothetical protein